jgi:hypothetical protein
MKTQQIINLHLCRLPSVNGMPGLVSLTVCDGTGDGSKHKLGDLTDVALRGRLAHYDLHPANELAVIRRALQSDNGEITIHEGWPGLQSCLKFWNGFTGSRIRPVEWTCENCAAVHRDNVGSNVGETYARACRCGRIQRITTISEIPARPSPGT